MSPNENSVSDETVIAGADLITDIEPAIQETVDALSQDPTNEELLDELRDKSIRAWSSDAGLELATRLDASETPDPTYLQLRESAERILPMLCEQAQQGSTKFSQEVVNCICGNTDNPSTYCTALANRELLDYLNTTPGLRRRKLQRRLACSADFDELYNIFEVLTEGEPLCLQGTCEFPFPPAPFLGVELQGGGCLPGVDLQSLEICVDGSCESIEDQLENVAETNLVNQLTDSRVFVKGGICLLGTDKFPFLEDVIFPLLEFVGLPKCIFELELSFWPLMGYLAFSAIKNGFPTIGINVEAQFYDDVKELSTVCSLLEGDQCSGQEDSERGQNSCSLCAGEDRGEFYIEFDFFFFKKKFDFDWGDGLDGECKDTCRGKSSESAIAGVEAVLEASKEGIDNNLFLYETPEFTWVPSTIYRYDGFSAGLKLMYKDGVAGKLFYMGDGSQNGHYYGLVNIAAFLAQSMKETIQYDACDENSWDDSTGRYAISNSCGQLGQAYQDYHCSEEEAHMECAVDPNMQITGVTNAKWWGAPAPMKCGPKSVYPFTGYWDHLYECNKSWLDPPEVCTDYEGQLGGGENNEAAFASSIGRTDVEGCCWWGRGVIQTTGVCNFGKLNYYVSLAKPGAV